MGRCYGCCQENCGHSKCSCPCHESASVQQTPPPKKEPYSAFVEANRRANEEVAKSLGLKLKSRDKGTDTVFVSSETDPKPVSHRLSTFASQTKPAYCKTHPSYRALKRPRSACESCWRAWIKRNPEVVR